MSSPLHVTLTYNAHTVEVIDLESRTRIGTEKTLLCPSGCGGLCCSLADRPGLAMIEVVRFRRDWLSKDIYGV